METQMKPEGTMLHPSWKELIKIASDWEYESLHSHAEISNILCMEAQTSEYYQAVVKANASLTLIGKRLDNVQSKGYMVVRPGEYVNVSQKQKDRGLRHYRTAAFVTGHAPLDRMTDRERMINDQHHIRNSSVVVMLEKDRAKSYKIINTPSKIVISERKPEENEDETD